MGQNSGTPWMDARPAPKSSNEFGLPVQQPWGSSVPYGSRPAAYDPDILRFRAAWRGLYFAPTAADRFFTVGPLPIKLSLRLERPIFPTDRSRSPIRTQCAAAFSRISKPNQPLQNNSCAIRNARGVRVWPRLSSRAARSHLGPVLRNDNGFRVVPSHDPGGVPIWHEAMVGAGPTPECV